MKPALVIMAAGLGSRYGGLKQIDPIGPNGEIIIDYSIYDALKAGFGKIVFVINKELEDVFRDKIGNKIDKVAETAYVYQNLADLPAGFSTPRGRKKPWGTVHAVLSCRDAVNTPFAVINADDFYGFGSYKVIADFLKKASPAESIPTYCMVGFSLKNTLSENGSVSRAICLVNREGFLSKITERKRIAKFGDAARYTEDGENWFDLENNCTVSMNIWGFTPHVFNDLEASFSDFLEKRRGNIEKAEYLLSEFADDMISEGKAKIKVLSSKERWYGVTYREDREMISRAVGRMVSGDLYPENMWGMQSTKKLQQIVKGI